MAYDQPRPTSQPTGSTDVEVLKDNLITHDLVVNAQSGTEITNRKGQKLTPLVDVIDGANAIVEEAIREAGYVALGDWAAGVEYTQYNQVYFFNKVAYRPLVIPYTAQGADPTVAPDLTNVSPVESGITELESIELSLNVAPGSVIYSTDIATAIPDYIRNNDNSTTYSVPNDAKGKFIQSVVGSTLTTADNVVYQLLQLESRKLSFESVADMKAGTLSNGFGTIDWSLVTTGTEIQWLGYYSALDGGDNNGILQRGAHTDDGGSVFSIDANTYIKANMKDREVSALKFGAKANGVAFDNMPAFKSALAANDAIAIPADQDGGFYGVGDGTLVITKNKSVTLKGSAVIIRASTLSSDTSPVIWLEDESAALLGETGRSGVRSQSPTPEGVVLVGAESMDVPSKNMFNCRINSISVQGHKNGGNTTGEPTYCIKVNAPQYSNETACYFHRLTNIKVDNANYGIALNGFANANWMSNIFGQNLGDNYLVGGALIWFHGAQENNIHGLFHHTSINSVAIKSTTWTGLAGNPSAVRVPGYNHGYGIIAEAGAGSRTLVIDDETSNNMFFAGKNSPLGSTYPPGFFESSHNNTVFENGFNNSNGSSYNRVDVKNELNMFDDTSIEGTIYQEKQGRGTVQERESESIFTVKTGEKNGGVLDVTIFARSSLLNRITGISKKFLVSEINEVEVVTEISGGEQNQGLAAVTLTANVTGPSVVTFVVTGANNGTPASYSFTWNARYQVDNLVNALVKL